MYVINFPTLTAQFKIRKDLLRKSVVEYQDAFHNELASYMTYMPEDLLVMHVRSGDIFGDGYYTSVMNERNWSKVLLFAEDTVNPCVNILKKAGAEHIQSDLHKEIALMLSTKNLVVVRGSFGMSMAFISKELKNLWTFANGLVVKGLKQQKQCKPDRGYTENVYEMKRRSGTG